MNRTRHILLTLGLALSLGGCMGVHNGHPETRGPRYVSSRQRGDLAKPARWRQIFLGSPPKQTLVGYLRTIGSGINRGGHVVYDTDFNVIGRITPKGQTVRVVRGRERQVGGYPLKYAILRLHLREKRTEVSLRPMPDPRG